MTVSSTEEFIMHSNIIHVNKYTYNKTVYLNTNTKVTITCPIHGDFEQVSYDHLRGYGCRACANEYKRSLHSHKDKFVDKAKTVHGDKYLYDNVVYKNNKTPVSITCPIHGDFLQAPQNHTNQKQGCPKCPVKLMQNTWSYTSWEEAGSISKSFVGYSFYILECWNDTERFFKLGKTYLNINKRYNNLRAMPYEWKLVYQEFGSARYISELETGIHKKLTSFTYTPLLPFGGRHECYILPDYTSLQKYL